MAIEVVNLRVRLGRTEVLHRVSFSVNEGELCAILGPNGAGKTTLLRTIARFIKPVEGYIKILGRDAQSYPRHEFYKLVTYSALEVPRGFRLLVRDLLEASLYNLRLRREEVESRIEWVSNLMEIENLLYRRIDTLSSGELQRVILATTIIRKPRILLLDEPTAHLDIRYQLEISGIIKSLTKSLGITTLMATHDIRMAAEFSDVTLVLSQGKQVAFGKSCDVLRSDVLERVYGVKISILRDSKGVAVFTSL